MKTRPYDNTPSNWIHFMNTTNDRRSYTLSLISNGLCNPEKNTGIPNFELAQTLKGELLRFGYTPIWVIRHGVPVVWDPANGSIGGAWLGSAYKISITETGSIHTVTHTAGLVDRSLGNGLPWNNGKDVITPSPAPVSP